MLVLTLLLACTWTPPVDTGRVPEPTAALSGTLVSADGTVPQGPTLVFLYDAADPPPPAGFGRPADFSAVPATAWAALGGLASAPWSLTGVPSGSWLLTALVDEDQDFSPFYDFTAGATCGDRTGAYLGSTSSTSPAVIPIDAPDIATDVPVLVGSPLTTERPAFTVEGGGVDLVQPASLETYTGTVFNLASVGVENPLLSIAGPTAETCPSVFEVSLVDADGDGVPDPDPDPSLAAMGALSMWPRVYLFFVADAEGNLPAEGESWVSQAVIYAPAFGVGEEGGLGAGQTIQTATLPLLWVPAALHVTDGTQETEYAPGLPTGLWGVAVFTATGQTWVVPNQLSDAAAAMELGTTPDSGQGALVVVSG